MLNFGLSFLCGHLVEGCIILYGVELTGASAFVVLSLLMVLSHWLKLSLQVLGKLNRDRPRWQILETLSYGSYQLCKSQIEMLWFGLRMRPRLEFCGCSIFQWWPWQANCLEQILICNIKQQGEKVASLVGRETVSGKIDFEHEFICYVFMNITGIWTDSYWVGRIYVAMLRNIVFVTNRF